jgi:hypothetical protein
MFLIGALPAFLCVFIQMRLKEPEKWVAARAAGKATGVKFGSYVALLGDKRWRSRAIVGMLLCISGVIGLWGIGFFSPELINDVIGRSLKAEGIEAARQPGYRTMWVGLNMIIRTQAHLRECRVYKVNQPPWAARLGVAGAYAISRSWSLNSQPTFGYF